MTARGVAHRDLKSENIIINPDTLAIKLIDFGLGIEVQEGDKSVDSAYRGTPVYMAPGKKPKIARCHIGSPTFRGPQRAP